MEGENNNRRDNRFNGNNGNQNRNRFQNRRPYNPNERRGERRDGGDNRQFHRDNRRPQRPPQVVKHETTAEEIAAETRSIEAEIKMEIEELRSLRAKFGS